MSLVAASALFHHSFIRFADTPTDFQATVHELSITPGMNLTGVAQVLAETGLIDSAFKFRLLARSQNQSGRIQAGEYELRSDMTPREILKILVQGRVKLNRLTIPEGFTIKQIASAVEAAGLVNAASFEKAAADPDTLGQYAIPNTTAEGYLYPETYFFTPKTSGEVIVNTMLRRFETVFTDQMKNRAEDVGLFAP